MKKSPQYNQRTELKQWKSDVEEICIPQDLKTGPIAAQLYLKMVGSMLERIPLKQQYLKVIKLGSYMKQ